MGDPAGINRRDFLKGGSATLAALAGGELLSLSVLRPASAATNPLEHYPDRGWEQLYRDVYSYDDTFIFTCTPNDTHNCYLRAFVKNGVVTRCGPSQRYHEATDLYGTKCSQRWDPRHCNKGLAVVRRFNGDRRVKGPMVRRGFKEWVERGFPRDEQGMPPADLFRRGEDGFQRVGWEEALSLAARTHEHLARFYSGEEGSRKLEAQGYHPEMVKACEGAGTRTFKFRGGMPVLGSIKLFGQYRQANSMALLDAHVRGVAPGEAKGGVGLDNYSWHTDLPPGHPMVTGQQTIDFDLSNVEYSKLALCWGMNWISTKMPDAHFLTEARAKGTKVVSITTEYSSTCCRSDEIVIIRPGTDPAFALGIAREIIDNELYDAPFVKGHTDLPLLVRMDTQELLRASDAIPGYRLAELERTRVVKPDAKAAPWHTDVGEPMGRQERRGRGREPGRHREVLLRARRRPGPDRELPGPAGREAGRGASTLRPRPAAPARHLVAREHHEGDLGSRQRDPGPRPRDRRQPGARALHHRHGPQPDVQRRPEGPRGLPGGRPHTQRGLSIRKGIRRRCPGCAIRCACSRRTSTATATRPSRWAAASSMARATCRCPPSCSGSRAPTRSSATPRATTTW
jgi:nitrate reductase alpha subunit